MNLLPPRPSLKPYIFGFGLAVVAASSAFAAEGGKGASEVVFLFQLMALIFTGRLLGEAMHRMGQPAVTGQLIAGILLGPTVLGVLWADGQHWLFPAAKEQKAMLDAVSQIGVLMLLLLTGMETDLRLVRRAGRAAASVSAFGIVIPFACGFALGEMLPESMLGRPDMRIITSLFLGTALSIASIKIVAMVVREMNYMRRNLGQLIVSSAIIDDSVGWIIIAIIFSLAEHGAVDIPTLAQGVLGTLVFLALSFTIGRRIVFFIIRWTNDNFVTEVPVISAILLIMGGMALITHFIGVHTVLGAFIAGVLIGESPILTKHIDEQLRGLVAALFAPVFFGAAGLGTDLTILKDPKILALTIALILIASVGKFGGAFIGGKIGGLTRQESFALALGMNARGSTEVIIATIGLSLGALTQDLFSMIVAMAVITTMAMPPTLRWALSRLPLRKEEEERLQREAFAERGFVTNLERLLLAVDDSPNGKLATYLGGFLTGSLGMPATVLPIAPPSASGKKPASEPDTATAEVKPAADDGGKAAASKTKGEKAKAAIEAVAEKTKPLDPSEDAPAPADVEVTAPVADATPDKAVAAEASKGYDLLLIGLDNADSEDGLFDEKISNAASGFPGPVGVVIGRGERPQQKRPNILVPITGTGVSRRGAELALALARASKSTVTALYVSSPSNGKSKGGRLRRAMSRRGAERAILKDAVELADNFDVKIKIAARVGGTPEETILKTAKRGKYDLIVMGVSRRPGETLNFGSVAAAILDQSETSILYLASEAYTQEARQPEPKKEAA